MTDNALHEERKPALVAGVIIGVVIAVAFTLLFAWLAGLSLSAAPVIAVLALMVGWMAYCTLKFGPMPTEQD